MASKKFSKPQWDKIIALAKKSPGKFGFPARRGGSVVIGTFNIRKLGELKKRSAHSWKFLESMCKRFDLLAVQEVMDETEGAQHLKKRMGRDTGLVISDVTGVFPGARGNAERLAFLFNKKRVSHTELASDITFDRSEIVRNLFENRKDYRKTWNKLEKDLKNWEKKCRAAKRAGKKKPAKPKAVLPRFLTFIRQPHCASFQVLGRGRAKPIEFLTVNAHLLYGTNKRERRWEFNALIDWLVRRAQQKDRMYHENILMMGDCNLEFNDADDKRDDIDKILIGLNKKKLRSKFAAEVNFPLLSPHPKRGLLKTTARHGQTYDQIALFCRDSRLPRPPLNKKAGLRGPDNYDYGVIDFTDLFSVALLGTPYNELNKSGKKWIIARCEHDVSDHMPAWFRLPIPKPKPKRRASR